MPKNNLDNSNLWCKIQIMLPEQRTETIEEVLKRLENAGILRDATVSSRDVHVLRDDGKPVAIFCGDLTNSITGEALERVDYRIAQANARRQTAQQNQP